MPSLWATDQNLVQRAESCLSFEVERIRQRHARREASCQSVSSQTSSRACHARWNSEMTRGFPFPQLLRLTSRCQVTGEEVRRRLGRKMHKEGWQKPKLPKKLNSEVCCTHKGMTDDFMNTYPKAACGGIMGMRLTSQGALVHSHSQWSGGHRLHTGMDLGITMLGFMDLLLRGLQRFTTTHAPDCLNSARERLKDDTVDCGRS
eukprot:4532109-Amphidinium_carterae.1